MKSRLKNLNDFKLNKFTKKKVIGLKHFHKFRMLKIILIIMLIFGSISTVMAAQKVEVQVTYAPISFVYDGKEYAPPVDQQSFILKAEDRTYIPIRFASYLLNKAIQWDGYTNTVTVHDPDQAESILISEYKLNAEVRNSNILKVDRSKFNSISLPVTLKDVTYFFDGELKVPPIELPGMIYNGRLYVPLRFFSESLNEEIGWNQDTYTVSAQSETYRAKIAAEQNPITPTSSNTGEEVKPTYESIKSEADTKIASLQERAYSYYIDLFFDYSMAGSPEAKEATVTIGVTKLEQFDKEFAGIIYTLRTKLSANGFSTDIADEYELKYEEEKTLARSLAGF